MKKILATAQLLIFSLIVFTQSVGINVFAQNCNGEADKNCDGIVTEEEFASFKVGANSDLNSLPSKTTTTIPNQSISPTIVEPQKIDTNKLEIDGLKSQLRDKQKTLSEKTAELEKVKAEVLGVQKGVPQNVQISKLNSEISKLNSEISDLKKRIDALENPQKTTETNTSTSSDTTNKLGINADKECLTNGQCSFQIYKLLGIRQDTTAEEAVSAPLFAQDVVLAVTFFIGTVVTIALIYSGLMLVFSGYDEKMAQQGKDGIKYALIGLVIVTFSYTIIRLVQYIAKG